MRVDARDLFELMPMHLCLDKAGKIVSSGRTVARFLGGHDRVDRAFVHIGPDGRETDLHDLMAGISSGKRVFLNLRSHGDICLRGHGVETPERLLLLNLGFGASLYPAIRAFDLTDSDFAPSDLAIEFLFLHEANKAALTELSRVNKNLKSAREHAQIMSVTDPLTGVLNRRGFEISFMHALDRGEHTPFALIHLDLDNFKQVNDRFGHATGDHILQQAAEAIRTEVRVSDKVCRAGGDEFLVLMFSTTRPEAIMRACGRIIGRIEALEGAARDQRISASIGIAICPSHSAINGPDLFERADSALYQAKASGRARAVIWQTPIDGHLG
jgi:diguanylate cyclase (GGDEF)-like protein